MKKILCLVLALALCVSMCACGGVDERYAELIACLDNHDYEGAMNQVMIMRQEAIDNGDIITDPQDEDYDLVNAYYHIASSLKDYSPDEYFGIWADDLEDSLEDNAALAYCYEKLQTLEGVDQWLGHSAFSFLEENGIALDRQSLLDRFSMVENKLLTATSKTTDNMGNEDENEYGSWFYDENGTLTKEYISWNASVDRWEDLISISGYYRYTCNDAGVITEIKVTDQSNTSVNAVIVPAYDAAGNMISETITDNNGTKTLTYTYDDAGNRIQMNYADDWNDYIVYYSYDDQGNLIQKDVCRNSSMTWNGETIQYVSHRTTTDYTYVAGNKASAVVTNASYSWTISSNDFSTQETSRTVDNVSYDYDAEGRLTQETWQYGTTQYEDGDTEAPQYATCIIEYTYGDFYIFQ